MLVLYVGILFIQEAGSFGAVIKGDSSRFFPENIESEMAALLHYV
jgi:hypothetical protein